MFTSRAQTRSHCHKKAKVHPGARRLHDARGSLRGAETALGLLLGRGAPASHPPQRGGGLSIAGGCYGEI